jgi:hypothetical protein
MTSCFKKENRKQNVKEWKQGIVDYQRIISIGLTETIAI